MKHLLNDPRVVVDTPGHFRLKDHVTDLPEEGDKKELKERLEKDRERISDLQELLYAGGRHALLLIFQAMDAAGKDSAIRHVMSGVNPQGVRVWSFKAPSSLERSHDFLWRHTQAVPERGHIGIHNRSHYEEVLVTRVHPQFILGQNIPGVSSVKDIDEAFWSARCEAIAAWEKQLAASGTVIMKFYLHMSRAAQKKRFLERIDDPAKHWKFNPGDVAERAHWNAYMHAYEQAIGATAAPHAPWYIIPADEQWESRALVGRLIRERLEALDLRPPKSDPAVVDALASCRAALMAE
ncbi:MAG TPA: polyphosphate kinase 2 family protein [Flavobacteriales bacterium]|nr:polyphosphate kinase 2 family protein [Flavobacteriales bacterium]HMR26705.1 polyphosphate kinase 2 family protein [Flavobacteriales bacterium]